MPRKIGTGMLSALSFAAGASRGGRTLMQRRLQEEERESASIESETSKFFQFMGRIPDPEEKARFMQEGYSRIISGEPLSRVLQDFGVTAETFTKLKEPEKPKAPTTRQGPQGAEWQWDATTKKWIPAPGIPEPSQQLTLKQKAESKLLLGEIEATLDPERRALLQKRYGDIFGVNVEELFGEEEGGERGAKGLMTLREFKKEWIRRFGEPPNQTEMKKAKGQEWE